MRTEQADTLKLLPPYLFAQLEQKVAEMKAAGKIVFDMSIGDPDLPTPPEIVAVLRDAAGKQENQGYSSSRGEPYFREAVANWYHTRFGVELDPSREICAVIGTKEGIANLARAFINPGDKIGVPDPAYPVYANGAAVLTGGEPVVMPLLEENGFLPDLDSGPLSKVKLMFLNYPNNPTGAVAGLDFLKKAVDFSRDDDIILCYDNAYSEISFGPEPARSILEVPGAMECCVEFNSCSKTFNMTGSRIGFAAGAPDIIAGLIKLKSQIDSGPVPYIQRAASFGLDQYKSRDPPEMVRRTIETYRSRMELMVRGMNDMGIACAPSPATFYLWIKTAGKSIDLAMRLLDLGVVITPGIGFGEYGEGYVRVAMTKDDSVIREVLETMREADINWG